MQGQELYGVRRGAGQGALQGWMGYGVRGLSREAPVGAEDRWSVAEPASDRYAIAYLAIWLHP